MRKINNFLAAFLLLFVFVPALFAAKYITH